MSVVCKVKWCAAGAGESGYCGPHQKFPPLEGENVDAWTSRAGRLHKAQKRLAQNAAIVYAALTEVAQAKWQILMATKLTSHYVGQALKHLVENGEAIREGKHAATKYKKALKVAA